MIDPSVSTSRTAADLQVCTHLVYLFHNVPNGVLPYCLIGLPVLECLLTGIVNLHRNILLTSRHWEWSGSSKFPQGCPQDYSWGDAAPGRAAMIGGKESSPAVNREQPETMGRESILRPEEVGIDLQASWICYKICLGFLFKT